MLRRLIRRLLLLVLAASFAGTALTGARIAADPGLSPLREAGADWIRAETDRLLAETATPEAVAERMTARLDETPRNWLALDALKDLAEERGIPLPDPLRTRFAMSRAADHGVLAQAASCAACAYDPAQCSLSQVMFCQAPIALTPIGDVAGITRAGVAYASGEAVDGVDLALSVVGLGATVAVIASGGSSVVVKAGAGLAKLARKMGRLSPRLVAMATDAVRTGVDWAMLPAVRSVDELRAVIRTDAFLPLTATLTDLERLRAATDTTTALHLLPLVDDAADARKLAVAAEALGPKTVGRAEMLGKARLMRATLRLSDTALTLAASLSALFLSLAGLVGAGASRRLSRALLRKVPPPPAG